jgi:hypothetical protein
MTIPMPPRGSAMYYGSEPVVAICALGAIAGGAVHFYHSDAD